MKICQALQIDGTAELIKFLSDHDDEVYVLQELMGQLACSPDTARRLPPEYRYQLPSRKNLYGCPKAIASLKKQMQQKGLVK